MSNASIQGSNAMSFDSLIEQVTQLGNKEGDGFNSRPDLAILVCRAGAESIISTGPDDKDRLKRLHMTYVESAKKAANNAKSNEMKSIDQQLSKLRACIRLGNAGGNNGFNFDGPALLQRVRAIHSGSKELKGSTFDAMVTIARKQVENEYRAAEMTDEQIIYHLTPEGGAEKTELELAKSLLGSMIKMRDGNENSGRPAYASQELMGAINWMEALVDRLSLDAEKQKLLKLEQRVAARDQKMDAAELRAIESSFASSDRAAA